MNDEITNKKMKRSDKYRDLAESLQKEKEYAIAEQKRRAELKRKAEEEKMRQQNEAKAKEILSELDMENESAKAQAHNKAPEMPVNDDEHLAHPDESITETVSNKLTENIQMSQDKKLPQSNIKQIWIIGMIFITLLAITLCFYLFNSKTPEPEPEQEVIVESGMSEMPPSLKDKWLKNKAINNDYVGNVVFDSELIDLPIVQATEVYDRNGHPYAFYTEQGLLVENVDEYNGNDVYIWTNWQTGEYDPYGDGGSVFMDFRNNLADQNLIIYGHHFARDFDPSGSKQFTPLDILLDSKKYDDNKTLKLILNNEIREYVITNVFTINIDNDYELNIMRRNMNEDYSGNADPVFFKDFIEYIDGINKYPISDDLSDGDNILTLVTCLQHQPELRQIIIAKETNRIVYD